MIAFITSIRHPYNAKDFKAVEQLFEGMAISVCAQSSKDFKLIVVCNQVPNIDFRHPNIEYVVVNFPAPSEGSASNIPIKSRLIDKGAKIAKGCAYASKYDPTHFFIVDADDFIHKDVAKFLSKPCRKEFSYYANSGYILNKENKMQNLVYGMVRYCGSTVAISSSFLNCAIDYTVIDEAEDRNCVLDHLKNQGLLGFFGEHAECYRILAGTQNLKAIPFPATCWLIGHGENRSGTTSTGGKSLKPKVVRNFNIREKDEAIAHETKIRLLFLSIKSSLGSVKSYLSWKKSLKSGKFFY